MLIDEHVFTDVASVIGVPNHSTVGLFYGNVQFIKADGTNSRFLDYQNFPFFYYADNSQCQQVCFYRKQVFDLYGLFDASFKIYGDQEFNARITVKHNVKCLHLNRTIVRYTEGGYSEQMMSTDLNQKEKLKIKKRYFGETPNWLFDRLKSDYVSLISRSHY